LEKPLQHRDLKLTRKTEFKGDHGKGNELENMHLGRLRLRQQQAANSPKNGEEKKTRKYFNLTRQNTGRAWRLIRNVRREF
jgi:hypothetical protein